MFSVFFNMSLWNISKDDGHILRTLSLKFHFGVFFFYLNQSESRVDDHKE